VNDSILNVLAQATPSAGSPGAPAGESVKTIFELVVQGGLVMVPIAVCSIVALAIIVERLVVTRRSRVIPTAFLAALPERLDDPAKAAAACKADGSPIAAILGVVARQHGRPQAIVEKRAEEEGMRQIVGLRKRMRVLSALPQVSTMLGLLGTIFGMIRTFRAVASSGEALGKTELLARGIHEAWVATASGLLVAIPVMIAYHALQGRIDGLIADMDGIVREWLDKWEAQPEVSVRPIRLPTPAPSPDGQALQPASA
jgi:biopolymer transport protein ExbB